MFVLWLACLPTEHEIPILRLPTPVAERSKTKVCVRSLAGVAGSNSLAGIAGSNPAVGMDVLCCVCFTVKTKGKSQEN